MSPVGLFDESHAPDPALFDDHACVLSRFHGELIVVLLSA